MTAARKLAIFVVAPRLLGYPHIMRYLLALVLLFGTSAARADDTNETDSGKPADKTPSHADPATKTLPATASATAKANAFGQQGAREKAAHQAATAAAADQAKQAAAHKPPAPNSHANSHAQGASASSHAAGAPGLANAAAHRH